MGLTNAQLFDRWVDWDRKTYQQEYSIMREALREIIGGCDDPHWVAHEALDKVSKSEEDRAWNRHPKWED